MGLSTILFEVLKALKNTHRRIKVYAGILHCVEKRHIERNLFKYQIGILFS